MEEGRGGGGDSETQCIQQIRHTVHVCTFTLWLHVVVVCALCDMPKVGMHACFVVVKRCHGFL